MCIRDRIKVSRTVKETAVRARQLQAKYEAAYGIEPTVCQLASLMQIAPEELASALSSSQEVESLQKTIYQSDGNAILLEDRLESKENEQEKLVNRLALKKVMCELPDQEQKIIIMRYYSGQTQVQTAKCLGISQVQVSRIEKRVLKKDVYKRQIQIHLIPGSPLHYGHSLHLAGRRRHQSTNISIRQTFL